LSQGTANILEEQIHIKDAASRIIVELVKRDWPQLWQSLQKDLYDLCQLGVSNPVFRTTKVVSPDDVIL